MKKLLLFLCALLCTHFSVMAQTVEFSDDFESGADNWVLEGAWGLTTAQANSPSNSLTDSPGGNYAADQDISATMTTGVDLSAALDATLNFSAIYDIENGNFDYCYVEASSDGATWLNIATIFGEGNLTPWVDYSYTLGGFVGNDDVKVRFRFFSDGGYEVDGIYIDDVEITSSNIDNSAPLIVHEPLPFYEGSVVNMVPFAEISDISDLSAVSLTYSVDGGSAEIVNGLFQGGNTFAFIIPAQAAGVQVDYFIEATDASDNMNSIATSTYSYIAGQHIFYDDGSVDFVNSFGPDAASALSGCAVRFTMSTATDIKYALIRNYTDANRPNDDIEFHIWADDNGLPGADLVTPFMVTPEATLMNNSPMTRVDLSAFSTELAGITGDVFMGFVVPSGETWLVQTTPAVGGRTYTQSAAGVWAAEPDDDYHFRIVTAQGTAPLACADAADLNTLVGQGIDNTQTSVLFDNTDVVATGMEPTDGIDCFGEQGGPAVDNPLWYTFNGDGGAYTITINNCNGLAIADFPDFGDLQMAIYSGDDCGNLTPVACSEDISGNNFIPSVDLETTDGVTYYIMMDGYDGTAGAFCVEMTEYSLITCADIALGASSGVANVCFGATTDLTLDGATVIPTVGPFNGVLWAVHSADVSGSTDPFNEASWQGNFGIVTDPGDVYTPQLLNDGTQLAAGTYFFTPIVFAGAVGSAMDYPAVDFSSACLTVGTSVEVTLLEDLDDLAVTESFEDEVGPPGNNGSASVVAMGGSGDYTYAWDNMATTASIDGLAAGDYTVTISDVTGCVDDVVITITVDFILDAADLEFTQAITLTPNPARNLAELQYNFTESKDLQVTITNSVGQLVTQQRVAAALNGSLPLNVEEYATGVYFVNLTDGQHQATIRMVIAK